jgi:carbon-monoxide dehydrogenase small subunit
MKAFLKDNPNPSRAEIRDALSGHVCRCTGYHDIVESVVAAAAAAAAAT